MFTHVKAFGKGIVSARVGQNQNNTLQVISGCKYALKLLSTLLRTGNILSPKSYYELSKIFLLNPVIYKKISFRQMFCHKNFKLYFMFFQIK